MPPHRHRRGRSTEVRVQTFSKVWSPELENRRAIDVYLPASYALSRRRYPVVYMHDGQNLSNPATAFAGTWELPSVLRQLARENLEPIVVGIHHAARARLDEYSPFPDSRHGGGLGDRYLRFIVRTLKPRIDRRFRTLRGRDATAVAGSSMGGLISLYAAFRHRAVFGAAAALSPALWFGDRRIFDFVERSAARPARVYLDVGTAEGAQALRDARRMRRLLAAKAVDVSRMTYLEAEAAPHAESAWAARLPDALRFMVGPRSVR
jgi:predicted alpha/beta superfamily hydrolase